MGKGAALRWLENVILARDLHGTGAEIGALWRKFPVGRECQVWYVDRSPPGALQAAYTEVSQPIIAPDVVADAAQLPFRPGSLDFIIASHVLEHLAFPLAALQHWYEALAPGGVLVLKIPDKRYTFDSRRESTSLQHLVAEHARPESFDKQAHFEEWVERVVGRPRGGTAFHNETAHLLAIDSSIHYHAWTSDDVLELVEFTRHELKLHWRLRVVFKGHFYRKECALSLRRG